MEIGLNKQENTKSSEFVNFSIREYVAEIRKKDRKKCWPFGSLGDPDKYYNVFASYQSVESSSLLCNQNCPSDHIDSSDDKPKDPKHKEASNSSNKQTFNGKDDRSQTTDMIESPRINDNMCKRTQSTMVAQNRPENSGSGDELGRNQPRRKHHRVRLLSDIFRNLDNDAISKKQKGVEVTTMSKKKMMTDGVEESKLGKEEKSNCGSNGNDSDIVGPVISGSRKTRIDDVDFQTMGKRKKVRSLEENGTKATETENEDSEMEAVMLLAMHFNEVNSSSPNHVKRAQMEVESLEASNCITSSPLISSSSNGHDQGFEKGTTCACVQKKIRGSLTLPANESITKTSSKTATQDPTIYLECSINRNPADFSIPNAKNLFMRGG